MEGVAGRPPSEESETDCAREVYDAYEALVREAARGPLRFLAEIHGNNHRDAAGRIEIATVGVDRELAFRLRALLELIRDAHLDRKSTRLNSSHGYISYAVFCLKKKKKRTSDTETSETQ